MKSIIKKQITKLARRTTVKSIGRSLPFVVHEPKVPRVAKSLNK